MAKEYEFLPDPEGSDSFDKLLLSPRQRFGLLRWTLFGVVCLVGLLVQDVAGYRVNIFGGGVDIVPCLIFMITALQGAEQGCIFAVSASTLYYLTGSAPGAQVIPMITVIAVLAVIFRQACLRQGFGAILICAAGGMLIYEMGLFGICLFLGQTVGQRVGTTVLTALYSLAVAPIAYPILRSIGKIGGETWKE